MHFRSSWREDTRAPRADATAVIPLELAPLSEEERAHEARLRARIGSEIEAAGGAIPFARYMELALYAPGLGYYAAGAHKLGAGGDFVTAPELTPVFGRCLATQCAEILAGLGGGTILELGAGSGALAVEILGELARRDALPDAYRILEPSPDLRERQESLASALPGALRERLEWLERMPDVPFAGVLLANEVLDALPVERFRVGTGGIESLCVVRKAEGFGWSAVPADAGLLGAVRELEAARGAPFEACYTSEVCLRLAPWVATVCAPLSAGVALFIDYGTARRSYYSPERSAGTFSCYHRQRRHEDPFVNVGLQDLTAWVDFTAVAEAALAEGLEVAGYTSQANLLLALGFERHLAALRDSLPGSAALLAARTAARLVLPSEMGESFKCIALARRYESPLAGFSLRDYTNSL